jgi:peptidoglycan/xylan/chitin deacetylase (PgdA/CDA1 family)
MPLTAPELPAVLATLDRQNVHATFFVTAADLEHHRRVAALIAGRHTIGEARGRGSLASVPGHDALADEGPVFQRQLAVCPAFLRVAGNLHTPMLVAAARRRGMRLIGADVALNSSTSAVGVRDALRAIDNARPGSIINLHQTKAGGDVLPRVLPLIVEGLRAKGLQPVPIADLLGVSPYGKTC